MEEENTRTPWDEMVEEYLSKMEEEKYSEIEIEEYGILIKKPLREVIINAGKSKPNPTNITRYTQPTQEEQQELVQGILFRYERPKTYESYGFWDYITLPDKKLKELTQDSENNKIQNIRSFKKLSKKQRIVLAIYITSNGEWDDYQYLVNYKKQREEPYMKLTEGKEDSLDRL
jgi:hypothetical protein